jgi:hypothetical protein
MSTKNVGGNRRAGADAGYNDPFEYLGHFRNPKFMREGHNIFGIPFGPGSGRDDKETTRRRPLSEAEKAARKEVRASRAAGRAGILTARATGGDVEAAKAARKALVTSAIKQRYTVRTGEKQAARSKRLTKRAERLTKRAARLRGGSTAVVSPGFQTP